MSKIVKEQTKQRKVILVSIISLLCVLSVGYAAFQTTLNISAKGNISSKEVSSSDLKKLVVTTGDGLYADEYEIGRYIYRGTNPNNYITFNNETWRILSVENDGTLKIMKNESIENVAWDTSNSNKWVRPATLNTYLNNDYYNNTLNSESKNLIQTHTWGVGSVAPDNNDLVTQIKSENDTTWEGKVGLMTLSEFLRVNTNTSQCGNYSLNQSNYSACKTTNYIVPTLGNLWVVSPNANNTVTVFYVSSRGLIGGVNANDSQGYSPTVYLKSDITLKGKGTETNPYTIN